MISAQCSRAIEDASRAGKALLKFISPNDAGLTGSHQCGFYLPQQAWPLYTSIPPVKGTLKKETVAITWPDGLITESSITWYGQKTRDEFRLTRFGRGFPWLTPDAVGSLLIYIPLGSNEAAAYVLDTDEDINEVIAALGVDVLRGWAIYDSSRVEEPDEGHCLDELLRVFARNLDDFPTGQVLSAEARRQLAECTSFPSSTADKTLLACMSREFEVFKFIERLLVGNDIAGPFSSVENFIELANTILQRRKARAGRSFENHVDYILTEGGIPHDMRPPGIQGDPDVVIPGKEEYEDPSFPDDKLVILGAKRTCKDRWRQVLDEGPRVPNKHLITIQEGISLKQWTRMNERGITLIVPQPLHGMYPQGAKLQSVDQFILATRHRLGIDD